jgi:hypothetical protein
VELVGQVELVLSQHLREVVVQQEVQVRLEQHHPLAL